MIRLFNFPVNPVLLHLSRFSEQPAGKSIVSLSVSIGTIAVRTVTLGIWLAACQPLFAQSPGPQPPAAAPTENLRPVLAHLNESIAGLSINRWKAPGEVRSVAQRDADSIQRDLGTTLPPLLDHANAQPASMASAFAVYRNIDALYDVLLRISETAVLAGSQTDADTLQQALSSLEASRRSLGDAILQQAGSQEQELSALRAAAAQAAAAAAVKPAPPVKTVIDDGPESASKAQPATKRKKKPSAAQPAVSASPSQSPAAPPSQ